MSRPKRATASAALVVIVAFLILASVGVFRIIAYPRIHPGVGGGAAWSSTIELDRGDGVVERIDGILVDRGDALTALLTCDEDAPGGLQILSVPNDRVVFIELHEVVPLVRSSMMEALCP